MNLLDIIVFFVVIANLSLGIFVLMKGRGREANLLFFSLMLSTSGWVLMNRLTQVIKDYESLLIVGRITFFFPVLIVLFFVLFVQYFPRKRTLSKAFNLILIIISLFFAIITFTSAIIKDVIVRPNLPISDSVYGNIYNFFGLYLIGYFILGYSLLFRQLKNNTGIDRIKTKLLIIAFITATIFGLFTNLIYPMLFTRGMESQHIIISPYGPLMTVIIAIVITYSIVRYRFLDIRIVIRKSLVYFTTTAIIIFIYLYLLIFVQQYFVKLYHWSEQTSTIPLVLVVVLTIEPLRRFLLKMVDRAFYSKQRTSREESRRLKQLMSSSLQFDLLISRLTLELSQSLNVPKITFLWNNKQTGILENFKKNGKNLKYNSTDPLYQFIRDNTDVLVTEEIPYLIEDSEADKAKLLQNIERELKKDHIGLVLPIGEKGELVGALMMEPRKKNDAFTSDDVDYLSGLQFQMTGAIANALLYKQAVERIAGLGK